jgi:hypothetical protein
MRESVEMTPSLYVCGYRHGIKRKRKDKRSLNGVVPLIERPINGKG